MRMPPLGMHASQSEWRQHVQIHESRRSVQLLDQMKSTCFSQRDSWGSGEARRKEDLLLLVTVEVIARPIIIALLL